MFGRGVSLDKGVVVVEFEVCVDSNGVLGDSGGEAVRRDRVVGFIVKVLGVGRFDYIMF